MNDTVPEGLYPDRICPTCKTPTLIAEREERGAFHSSGAYRCDTCGYSRKLSSDGTRLRSTILTVIATALLGSLWLYKTDSTPLTHILFGGLIGIWLAMVLYEWVQALRHPKARP